MTSANNSLLGTALHWQTPRDTERHQQTLKDTEGRWQTLTDTERQLYGQMTAADNWSRVQALHWQTSDFKFEISPKTLFTKICFVLCPCFEYLTSLLANIVMLWIPTLARYSILSRSPKSKVAVVYLRWGLRKGLHSQCNSLKKYLGLVHVSKLSACVPNFLSWSGLPASKPDCRLTKLFSRAGLTTFGLVGAGR